MRISRRGVIGAGLALPWVRPSYAGAGTLNVYNWSDYIGETTVEDFQTETGIDVLYDLYASAEEMQARMEAGAAGYDLVVQSATALPRMVKAGIYQPLDRTLLKNWGNLDPGLLRIVAAVDPGNAHGAPYLWGSVGFTVNVDQVQARLPGADLTDLGTYLNPETAAKLSDCGISLLDSPPDLGFMVLSWLGIDPAKAGPDDIAKLEAALKAIRADVRGFDNGGYLDTLPDGKLCVANTWSGDFGVARDRAAEAGLSTNLRFVVPRTGAPAWFDLWCVPKDAASPGNAHAFIDYLLRPEVIAKCSDFTGYANANAAATPLVDKALSGDPAIYPDAETRARLYMARPLDDATEAALEQAWTRIKAN